jgi:hypothetical protein
MLDQQYNEQFRIKAANGLGADLHAFTLTAENTALISIYDKAYLDISSKTGTPTNAWIWVSKAVYWYQVLHANSLAGFHLPGNRH